MGIPHVPPCGKATPASTEGVLDDLKPPFDDGPLCKIERDSGRSSPLTQLELVPAEKLDRVLHAHHTEVATATRDAVVNGVAEQFLCLAG